MMSTILFAIATAEPVNPKSAEGVVPPITFVVTALFAVAVILLGFDLVRRVRRAHFRAEIQEKLAAELAAQRDGDATDAAGTSAAPPTAASDAADATEADPKE